MNLRKPVVAGTFYEKDEEKLKKQIEECFLHRLGPGELPKVNFAGNHKIIGLVSPHAGYMYSGAIAAWGFHHLAQEGSPEIVVILGPNHQGGGNPIALVNQGIWQTPLGEVKINEEIANQIKEASEVISIDETAHLGEHAIEVQLPFLQYIYGSSFSFVPLCMMNPTLALSIEVGKTIAEVLKEKKAVIIASTDFTHYESQEKAKRKDEKALTEILNLNAEKLRKVIDAFNISMCGPGPVISMLTATKLLGAKKTELLKYSTSGDLTGDYSRVVGYASVKVYK